MDQNEFRQLKESGGLVDDAGLHEAQTEVIDDQFDDEQPLEYEVDQEQEQVELNDAHKDTLEDDQSDDDIQLPEKEKTAFEKRMEREKVKLEEKLRAELEQQYEGKYSKHKQAIDAIGGDPDAILRAAQEAKMQREAEVLADRNGWSQEETQWYIDQQKQQQELKELRVQMQINRLKDNPDYAGIASMEKEIMSRIDKSNGALNVEEAYWALGGPKRIEQIKLEAQQREIAKRQAPARTVQKDSPSSTAGEKPLDPKTLAEAQRMGISEDEARKLMSAPSFTNIDEWRASRKQAN